MIKKIFTLSLLTLLTIGAINEVNAQVTIGSLNPPKATLDVIGKFNDPTVTDGILLPKLTGDELTLKSSVYTGNQHGVLVFVTAAASSGNQTGKTENVKAPGFYYYDATAKAGAGLWIPLTANQSPQPSKPEWFYMPPVPLDTEDTSIDLFAAYCNSMSVGDVTRNPGSDPFVGDYSTLSATDFDYYVVGYDDELLTIDGITDQGVMTYTVIGEITDKSYINIVFVKK